MNHINISKMKIDTQRVMAEVTTPMAQQLEIETASTQKFEPSALALILEAYLILSTNVQSDYAIEFLQEAVNNIEQIRDQIIHEGNYEN